MDRDANAPAHHVFDKGVVLESIILLDRLGLLILRRSSLADDIRRLRRTYKEVSSDLSYLFTADSLPDAIRWNQAGPSNLQKYAGRFGLNKDAQVFVHCLDSIHKLIAEAPKHGEEIYVELLEDLGIQLSRIDLGIKVASATLGLKA